KELQPHVGEHHVVVVGARDARQRVLGWIDYEARGLRVSDAYRDADGAAERDLVAEPARPAVGDTNPHASPAAASVAAGRDPHPPATQVAAGGPAVGVAPLRRPDA